MAATLPMMLHHSSSDLSQLYSLMPCLIRNDEVSSLLLLKQIDWDLLALNSTKESLDVTGTLIAISKTTPKTYSNVKSGTQAWQKNIREVTRSSVPYFMVVKLPMLQHHLSKVNQFASL